ncbi:hypothetical protein [Rhodopirellula sallentina]|uniref:Uncharacterized protein n=1 Tax=Rhodopirellula sallentina SM41 TaxID=1263870 RepID=M5U8H7_9BACT|nr:hypothetical protein [Rhodopirellula sallentina]EMI54171.1 hypothetical protein RSSM_04390 [Rhodopirellula sallentina SM41]
MISENDDDDLESLLNEFDFEKWERDRISQEDEGFEFNFGGSTSGGDVSGYVGLSDDVDQEARRLILKKFQGEVILDCRSEVLMIFTNNTFALLFRLTHGRQILGYGEGLGKLFRGKLIVGLTNEQIQAEAFDFCRTYSVLDGKGEPLLALD